MKHTVEAGLALLAEHHDRVPVDGKVQYPPRTAEAAQFWKHTGVCPQCSYRTISAGRCAECGWVAPGKMFYRLVGEDQVSQELRNFRYGHELTRNWVTTTQWWSITGGYACVVLRGLWDDPVVCVQHNDVFHCVEAVGLIPALIQLKIIDHATETGVSPP